MAVVVDLCLEAGRGANVASLSDVVHEFQSNVCTEMICPNFRDMGKRETGGAK
jgi:hypothetical protein